MARKETLAELVVKLAADAKDFSEGLERSKKRARKFGAGIKNILGGAFKVAAAGATAAGVAIGGLAVGLGGLAIKATPLEGIGTAFEAMSEQANVSLAELQKAAKGTISDFELMRQANVALTGAGGEFGEQFGKALPKLLETARAASKATGEDVGFLFESLVAGIKRSSPLMIDNTGLVLSLGEANEAMAAKLGKTVEELTDEEKQLALLNATVEAGGDMVSKMGSDQLTAAERLAKLRATIKNTTDQIGLAFIPVIEKLLPPVQVFAERIADKLVPFIQGRLVPALKNMIGTLGRVWSFISKKALPVFAAIASFIRDKVTSAIELVTVIFDRFREGLSRGLDPLTVLRYTLMFTFGETGKKIGDAMLKVQQVIQAVFIPAFQAVTAFLRDKVIPAVRSAIGWLKDQIPVAIQAAASVWHAVLVPAMQTAWQFIQDKIVPALKLAVSWLRDQLGVAAQAAGNFWTGTLVPALQTAWQFIQDKILPVFSMVRDWLADKIPLAVQAIATFWTGTLVPALQSVWQFIQAKVIPAFVNIAQWLAEKIPAAIGAVVGFFRNELIPVIMDLVTHIGSEFGPLVSDLITWLGSLLPQAAEGGKSVLETLGTFFSTTLPNAMGATWQFVKEKMVPALKEIITWVADNIPPAVEAGVRTFEAIAGAIGWVTEAIKSAISWLGNLVDKLGGIQLPQWLQRKSPSELEQAFLGTSEAMRKLAEVDLPRLETQLNLSEVGGGRGGGDRNQTINFNQTINTRATTPGVVQDTQTAMALMGVS
jgi:hypothetical protein